MKRSLTIILILVSLSLNSQSLFNSYERGKITFRNGKEISGLIKRSGNSVKFKENEKAKKIKYSYKELKKIKFRFGDEYLYKINAKNKSILLLKREVKGKLDLYSYERQSPNHIGANGMMIGGGISTTVYLIGEGGTDFVETLPMNPKKNKFRKIITKYTSDCPMFIELIKDKKSVKENFAEDYSGFFLNQGSGVIDMINYYNKECNN